MAIRIYTTQGPFRAGTYEEGSINQGSSQIDLKQNPCRIYHLGRDEDYAIHAALLCLGVPHAFEKIQSGEWLVMRNVHGAVVGGLVLRECGYFGTTFIPRKIVTQYNALTDVVELLIKV